MPFKHGFCVNTQHPLYVIWAGMKARCHNKNHKSYKNYGGRGIKIWSVWKNNPKVFIEWALSHGWGKGLLLDRKDNDGNYTPQNCRFVGAGVSARNKQLIRSDNTTGYRGVIINKNCKIKKYVAQIKINGKQKTLGYFKNPIEAAIAFDSMAVVLDDGRPTNFQ